MLSGVYFTKSGIAVPTATTNTTDSMTGTSNRNGDRAEQKLPATDAVADDPSPVRSQSHFRFPIQFLGPGPAAATKSTTTADTNSATNKKSAANTKGTAAVAPAPSC